MPQGARLSHLIAIKETQPPGARMNVWLLMTVHSPISPPPQSQSPGAHPTGKGTHELKNQGWPSPATSFGAITQASLRMSHVVFPQMNSSGWSGALQPPNILTSVPRLDNSQSFKAKVPSQPHVGTPPGSGHSVCRGRQLPSSGNMPHPLELKSQ